MYPQGPTGGGSGFRFTGSGGFNPADARSWGQFLAVPAQGISRQTNNTLEQLKRTLGPNSGAYRQAAGRAINQGYSNIAGLRQNLAAGALGDLSAMMSQSLGYNPAGPTGSASAAMNNLTNLRGQDLQNSQFGQSLSLQQQAINAQRDAGLFGGLGGLLGGMFSAGGTKPWWMSDPRVKTRVKPHKGGLTELRRLKTYDWEYNGKGGSPKGERKSGMMATDLKRYVPKAVFEVKTEDPHLPTVNVVDYSVVLATMANAVKELDTKVTRLSDMRKK